MFSRCIFSILLEHIFSKFICRMFNECVRCSLLNISLANTVARVIIGISLGKLNALKNNVLKITMNKPQQRLIFTGFNMSYIYDSYFDLFNCESFTWEMLEL